MSQILILGSGISLSTDAIKECVKNGIQINFLSSSGRPYAKLTSPELTGTVKTRREQILAYNDERGVKYSKAFVEGKIGNQMVILKYFAKYRKTTDLELYQYIYDQIKRMAEIKKELQDIEGKYIDEVRGVLLSIEGRSSNIYWDTIKRIISIEVDFEGREHQGAKDPVNSLLNYGYGILYSQVWGALTLAGLDPFAGFLHVDRPGKPSLVLDFIEEFRQQVVDRTVFGLINKGFKPEIEENGLHEATRREFAKKILERLESHETYEGKRHKLKTILQLQARHLASFFQGERDYKAWVGTW